MTDQDKLTMIGNICSHPGAQHWSGAQIAKTIRRVIDDDMPICFELSAIDEPIRYELVADAVEVLS